jgi:predicted nucleic acid-binding protein
VRILVDTNVVLDVLLARRPFLIASAEVFALVEHSRMEGLLCATTITTVDYLLTQSMPRPAARETLRKLLTLFTIAPVNRAVLEEALRSKVTDFEDAVLDQAGRLAGAEVIVTRNQSDFRFASLKVLGPDELLASSLSDLGH